MFSEWTHDLDEEIEKYFKKPIEYIQDEFLTTNGFRKKTVVVLNEILNKNVDMVIASTASGFRDHYLKQYKATKKSFITKLQQIILPLLMNFYQRVVFILRIMIYRNLMQINLVWD